MKTALALILAALLIGCVSDAAKKTPALTSAERGYAGTEADIDGVRRGLKMMLTLTGDPTLKALITSMDQAAADAQVKNEAVGNALAAAEKDASKQQRRAEIAESNNAAASRARYDWASIIAGAVGAFVAVGSAVLRAYVPQTDTTMLKTATVGLAILAGCYFVASLTIGVADRAMLWIGPGLLVCMVIVTVFYCVAHRRQWQNQNAAIAQGAGATLVNTVASMNTALAAVSPVAQETIKNVMKDVQSPATKAAVTAIKATLPTVNPSGDDVHDPEPTPAVN